MSTLKDFKVGDLVELDCHNLLQNTRLPAKSIGQITDIFDVLFEDGTEGNLEIDIRFKSGWVRYKPQKDGGTLTLITKAL